MRIFKKLPMLLLLALFSQNLLAAPEAEPHDKTRVFCGASLSPVSPHTNFLVGFTTKYGISGDYRFFIPEGSYNSQKQSITLYKNFDILGNSRRLIFLSTGLDFVKNTFTNDETKSCFSYGIGYEAISSNLLSVRVHLEQSINNYYHISYRNRISISAIKYFG